MGRKLLSAKAQKLSPGLVKEFATMAPVPRDRPLSERRLKIYRQIVDKGEFGLCRWASATCTETGEVLRVNGKHTSTMFAQMETIPDATVIVERYECDNIEDVVRLYNTFDSNIASRTTNDVNRSFAAAIPELAETPSKTISLAVSGMSFYKWRGSYAAIPSPERAELMFEHLQFVMWLGSTISPDGEARWLGRQPVVAAMFATWQRSQKDASNFWEEVRDESGDKPDLPTRKLAKFLTIMNVNMGQGSHTGVSRKAAPSEFYAKCIHAWNAWRKGEPTDLKYHAQAKPPVAV